MAPGHTGSPQMLCNDGGWSQSQTRPYSTWGPWGLGESSRGGRPRVLVQHRMSGRITPQREGPWVLCVLGFPVAAPGSGSGRGSLGDEDMGARERSRCPCAGHRLGWSKSPFPARREPGEVLGGEVGEGPGERPATPLSRVWAVSAFDRGSRAGSQVVSCAAGRDAATRAPPVRTLRSVLHSRAGPPAPVVTSASIPALAETSR